jgi:5-methylcytosine-specific restriction protein A
VSDSRRPSAHDRGYDRAWARTAARYLQLHPLCECDACSKLPPDRRAKATEVHHRDGLGPTGPNGHKHFNLRSMSSEHHGKETAKQQPGGWNG